MKLLVRSFAILSLALAAVFHIETAHALTCEQLFTADFVASLNSSHSEARSTYKTYKDEQKDLQNPDLFYAALEGERTVPADVLLAHIEHFFNYKHRHMILQRLKQVHLKNEPQSVVTDVDAKADNSGLQGWLFSKEDNSVNYFLHPTTESELIPYINEASRHEEGPMAVSTASRSMMVRTEDGDIFSVKMGTEYPDGRDNVKSLKKLLYVQDEVEQGMAHSKAARELEKRIGLGKTFSLTLDVASVTPETNIVGRFGMLVRDLNFLKTKDRYYLPAFSIPFLGPAIAKKFGHSYETFWQKHFAHLIGVAKAEMFLRYGMIMNWPHGQNILIETDLNFKPTGVIKVRDLDDVQFYDVAAQSLLSEQTAFEVAYTNEIKFHWDRTAQVITRPLQKFENDPQLQALEKVWQKEHDGSIRRILAKHLDIPELLIETNDITKTLAKFKDKVNQFFKNRTPNK